MILKIIFIEVLVMEVDYALRMLWILKVGFKVCRFAVLWISGLMNLLSCGSVTLWIFVILWICGLVDYMIMRIYALFDLWSFRFGDFVVFRICNLADLGILWSWEFMVLRI